MKKVFKYSAYFILFIALMVSLFANPISVLSATKEAETIAELRNQLAALKQEKIDTENAKSQTKSQINSKKDAIYNAYKEQEQNTF